MEGNKVEAHGRADPCKWIVGRSKPTHCHIPQLLVGKGDVSGIMGIHFCIA